MSADTTGWPLLEERRHGAPPGRPRLARRTRGRGRPVWALVALAFLCGGLVSAAGFAIGWKHLAQSGTAAQTRLAAANAHVRRLDASLVLARRAESTTLRRLAAAERAATRLRHAAAGLAAQAATSESSSGHVSGEAGAMAATAGRVASELKTLSSYLTSTPAGQVDSGYVSTQVSYLTRQLSTLQAGGADLGSAAAAFQADVHRLASEAGLLAKRR
jgi:hypothetical protein